MEYTPLAWAILGYAGIALFLSLYCAAYHIKRGAPVALIVCDALLSLIWPVDFAVRIAEAQGWRR